MGVLTLNIEFRERGVKKTMQFEPRMVVYDACRLIRDKLGPLSDNPSNYGLFRVEDDPTKCVWMENGRTLEYYLIRNGDTLEYKNKIRQLRVRTLDGGTVKTIFVDESQPVGQLMIVVCSKMGISNHEEYSLERSGGGSATAIGSGVDFNGTGYANGSGGGASNGYHQQNGRDKKDNTFMNTIGRKKERQIQQLRAKLHTDEDIQWVDHSKTLREQNVGEDEELILRRKYFFSDTNIDTRDPVQLNLLYLQCRDGVLKGLHPVSRDTAIKLAALQCYIEYGQFQEGVQSSINAKDLLPKEYAKAKEHEKNIIQEYRELIYEDQTAPKKKYCELCQSLPTYGVTFFLVKEKLPGKNKLIPRLLGINKDSVMRLDEKSKTVLKEWPLEQVRRWAASYKTFTLDFGDYKDGYYSVQTLDGEKICQLIGGYIDIIMKKKRVADHLGIEGDEGSTMLEDVVAPARATLVAHGELGPGYAQDGHVALPGVLRSGSATPAGHVPPQGLQYGAVGGQIVAQEMPRGERVRYVTAQERSQRALIGTIEATIRAVEEAEEEIMRPTHIDLPKFDETARHWRVEVEKEAVEDRIAAMGAATAEVVQLTAIPEESDGRVGTAITTIGSNLPEMSRGVRELAGLLPDENQAGDLIDAARKLCGAFGNFLERVHPEKNEKRANILSAASRVGELSHEVINTFNEPTLEDRSFHDQLNQRARNVATSTAKLVLQAKTVSADCNEPALKEQVIHSAMKTAFATSELIACTRIVGPTIEHPPSRQHLTEAAHNVARAVEELLVDANGACKRTVSGTGEQQYGDLHAAARQVSNALDELIDHVNLNTPGQQQYNRKTQQDYSYEQLLQSSNRVITHQGAPRDLMRDSESAIRHSRVLIDEFENEARTGPADQRDRLLNAARSVAMATSNMIDATKECQSRPQEPQAQMALKSAAENLVQITNEASSERTSRQVIQRLERAAKDVTAATTQAIAAANKARPQIRSRAVVEALVTECTETNRFIPPIVQRVKESQQATQQLESAEQGGGGSDEQNRCRWEQFRAQSFLIHETSQLIPPASKLVEFARGAVPHVEDQYVSANLLSTSQELSTQLAELRVALNNAQQLNFDLQLDHSEDLIRELDKELLEIGHLARHGELVPPKAGSLNPETQLTNAGRSVSSAIAQLVSSARTDNHQHIGSAALETAQSLRGFVAAIRCVASTTIRGDPNVDNLVLNARSVAHDSGRVFDRVNNRASVQQLEESVRTVNESLRKTLTCLPNNALIESAIERIRAIGSSSRSVSASPKSGATSVVNLTELRQIAAKLIESSSEVVINARAPQHSESVQIFVNAYDTFHTSIMRIIQSTIVEPQRQHLAVENLETARSQAINVVQRANAAHADPHNLAHTQTLSQASRSLTDTINIIVEQQYNNVLEEQQKQQQQLEEQQSLWTRECENALQRINGTRYLLQDDSTLAPLNANSYYESLTQVTNEACRLGDGMKRLANSARHDDRTTPQLCDAVCTVAVAVCGLAEHAAQSAYLIGAAAPDSQPGKAAIFDTVRCETALRGVCEIAEHIERGKYTKPEIINDATVIATHTSSLATICREASERSANVNVKRQFVNCARDITTATSALIGAVKRLDGAETPENLRECGTTAHQLRVAAENIEAFLSNPEFGARPARISAAGRDAQQPVIGAAQSMLDASCKMILTAKLLDTHPSDATTWKGIADNSRVVSESIKQLVAAIRDQAPGQLELDNGIRALGELVQRVDNTSMAASAGDDSAETVNVTEAVARQQILHAADALAQRVDDLRDAAVSQAEAIGHSANEHLGYAQLLSQSCVQAALLAHYDTRAQSTLFDQCKTVLEAEIQMFFAAKDAGGNPKATELHSIVNDAAKQLRVAIADLQSYVNTLESASGGDGAVHGLVETISRSITLADETRKTPAGDSFADAQTRMVEALRIIERLASEMRATDTSAELGTQSLELAERYRALAADTQIAQNLLTSPDVAQRVKLSVQMLGTSCIELVKVAGQRRQHPNDERLRNHLANVSTTVLERVREVLVALNEGSRGTQACINAAQTVSGIIGDLNTTIMFATSGSLEPPQIITDDKQQLLDGQTYKEVIIKTAKALMEDTKALVSGAASNQEQLAVAAQNAVRTILQLAEAVKGGAATISADSTESQVMVIHAVRDVAAALSNLIQATKHASGRSPTDPAIGNLKEAAKVMVNNVAGLLRTIKSVENAGQRGTQALEASINAIDVAVRQYDADSSGSCASGTVRQTATADEVIRTSRMVTDAVTRVTSAQSPSHSSGDQQELVIAAANHARQAVGDLLTVTRAAAWSADSSEVRYRLLDAGRDVALSVKQLLINLNSIILNPNDRQTRNHLFVASTEVAKSVSALTQCSEQLRVDVAGWQSSSDGADGTTGRSPGPSSPERQVAFAESELVGAANSIEEASIKLARLKPRHVHKPDENLTFDEQILSAAKSIASAVQTLVKAASAAQRELIEQGRMETRPALATDDYQWSEGLISAARLVAAAVHQLCEAANALVQGHATEEKLISAAKQVASSTAHLLVACKVKSDIDSRAMQRLQTAGHAVKVATEHLVNAAREAIVEDERALVISDRMVSGIAQVMDAQEAVLRKERELIEARNRLAAIHKSRYEKSPEPEEY